MIDTVIGIDPGKTGGICIKFKDKYKIHRMPAELTNIDKLLKYYDEISDTILVVIEQIRLHQTDNMAKVARMQKLFAQAEQIKTVMTIAGIPYIEVSPMKWQSYLNLRPKNIKKMDRQARKRMYRDFAENWFPEKLNLDVADSVCLMIYGVRNLKYNPDFLSFMPERLSKKLWG